MSWFDNSLMFWSTDGTTWNKITDHNRAALDVAYERIETKNRMVDGTLRRYSPIQKKKRTFSTSWTMLPSKRNSTYGGKTGLTTVDGGWAGEDMEAFHDTQNDMFYMKLRKGTDESKAASDGTLEIVKVMFSDFSKTIEKRGIVDLWSVSVTLEEV